MKKNIFLFIIASFLLFSSCKKSKTTPVAATPPQPYGELTAMKSFSLSSGSLILNARTGYADFRADISTTTFMVIGGVWANGTKFKLQSANNSYADSTNTVNIIPTTWQVTGAGPIPSFTYTNNDSLPGYTGYALLPDTIYKTQNQSVQINGISGADAIEVSFYNSTMTSNLYQYRSTGISASNTFSCTAASLSPLPLSTSSPTLLIVSVFKHNSQVIGGVTFNFITQLEINKLVYIK